MMERILAEQKSCCYLMSLSWTVVNCGCCLHPLVKITMPVLLRCWLILVYVYSKTNFPLVSQPLVQPLSVVEDHPQFLFGWSCTSLRESTVWVTAFPELLLIFFLKCNVVIMNLIISVFRVENKCANSFSCLKYCFSLWNSYIKNLTCIT